MPFSVAVLQQYQITKLRIRRKPNEKKSKEVVTLQVRILKKIFISILQDSCGKRAFLSIPASLTLEAVMSLTLFIFAVVCLILPMKIMNTERKIQAALEKMGEDYSQYAYVAHALEKGKLSSVAGAGDFAKQFGRQMISGAAQGYAQVQVSSYVDTEAMKQIRMLRSQILEDGETIDLVFDYEIRLPFPVLGLSALQRSARCKRRAWIGKEGKDYGEDTGGDAGEDPVVYIGKNSTRYHRSRSCHYLSNNLTGVARDKVSGLRNDNGGRYYPCAVCGKNAGSTVYIMPSGSSYHSSKRCTAIVAYARAVRLSEVEHLGACSYCGKSNTALQATEH